MLLISAVIVYKLLLSNKNHVWLSFGELLSEFYSWVTRANKLKICIKIINGVNYKYISQNLPTSVFCDWSWLIYWKQLRQKLPLGDRLTYDLLDGGAWKTLNRYLLTWSSLVLLFRSDFQASKKSFKQYKVFFWKYNSRFVGIIGCSVERTVLSYILYS